MAAAAELERLLPKPGGPVRGSFRDAAARNQPFRSPPVMDVAAP